MAFDIKDGFVCIWVGCRHVYWRHQRLPDGRTHCAVPGCDCILGSFMHPDLMFRAPHYDGPDRYLPPGKPING